LTHVLHSFPTRRSSDLFHFCSDPGKQASGRHQSSQFVFRKIGRNPFAIATFVSFRASSFISQTRCVTSRQTLAPEIGLSVIASRSEEHTSELQSLAYLV